MEGQKIFTYPNAVVRVHFADLSTEEHSRRMNRIHEAAEELLKEKIKNETHRS